jgi:predicted dehydrogenase
MTTTPVRIGLVGGGMISQIAHLPFYLGDPRCEVVRIAEARPSLCEALRTQLGPERVVGDHRALLDDPAIHAVVISMPRAATGPLTLAALEAGKHVLAEKPMAHSAEQARRLVDAARARGLTYAVGFMKRYDPGIQAAKALFERLTAESSLGRLLMVRFFDFSNAYAMAPPPHVRPKESRVERLPVWPIYPTWLPERYQAVYPWFLNAASHDVNLLRYFFPGDVEVTATACPNDGSLVASLRHGEVPIVLEAAKTVAGVWLEGAEWLFERGRLTLSIPSPMAMDRVSEITLDDERRGVVGERIVTDRGWSFARQARGFIDSLRGEAKPLTDGEEGLKDMMLIEQIWQRAAASI